MKKQIQFLFLFIGFLFSTPPAIADSLKVLFLGNSHTWANDLAQLTADLAASNGDTLIYAIHAPGGYTLGNPQNGHLYNSTSHELINFYSWNFVFLQEQSVYGLIDFYREAYMYPGASGLDSLIKLNNECTETIIQLIWAKRDGGQHCINEYCTIDFTDFSHMQDSLTSKYKNLADSLSFTIAPTGPTWQKLIQDGFATDLFAGDGNHPSLAGSYVAACVYYSTLFQKSPVGLSFTAGLSPEDALAIQQAADEIVFGNPSFWNINGNLAKAAFDFDQLEHTIYCHNLSMNVNYYTWDFGDGFTSIEENPVHTYEDPGTYILSIEASNPCSSSIAIDTVNIALSGQAENQNKDFYCIYKNSTERITIQSNAEIHRIEIFDITGRSRLSIECINHLTYSFDSSNLPKGIYVLVAKTEEGGKVIKFTHY
jgi:hypothetical protein